MIRSKATAALMRLKEIDRKYSVKRNEAKSAESNFSAESTASSANESSNYYPARPKLDVRMPDTRVELPSPSRRRRRRRSEVSETHGASLSLSLTGESTLVNREGGSQGNSPEIAVSSFGRNGEVEIASRGSSARTEIEEEIPSVAGNSESSRLRRSSPLEMDTGRSGQSERSESSKRIGESKTAKVPKIRHEDESEVSGTRSETFGPLKSVEERTGLNKVRAKNDEEKIGQDNSESDETIDEVIKTVDDKSDTVSRFSENRRKFRGVENSETKFSSTFEKIASVHKESDYESDTFEEASSSTVLAKLKSKSNDETRSKEKNEDTVRSGVKHIRISPRKEVQSDAEDPEAVRSRSLVELVPARTRSPSSECEPELDVDLSLRVRDTLDETDVLPPLSLLHRRDPAPKSRAKRSRRPHEISNESLKTVETRKKHVERIPEKTNVEIEEDRRVKGSASLRIESGDEKEGSFFADVTGVLRKLNREAIDAIVRKHGVRRPEKIGDSHAEATRGRRKIYRSRDERPREFEENDEIRENVLTSNHSAPKVRGRRVKTRKDSKAPCHPKTEENFSQPECRQAQRSRKRLATLTLQQERDSIRSYLQGLEGESLRASTAKPPTFKPLEFPKIRAYEATEPEDPDFKSTDPIVGLRQRVSTVRQWLKDQYVLYREYSDLARIVDGKYVPASLEDAKKTIRLLQGATIETR